MQIQLKENAWYKLSSQNFLNCWGNLYSKCSWATSCQSPEFVCTWFDTYKNIYSPVIIDSENDEGVLLGLLILAISDKNNRLVVAGDRHAEYQSWLALDCQKDFIVRALAALNCRMPIVGSLGFKYLPNCVPIQALFESEVYSKRIELKIHQRPLMKIEEDHIEKTLRKKSNKSRFNRIKTLGELEFKKITDKTTFKSIFEQIIDFCDFRHGAIHNSMPFQDDKLKEKFHINLMERCPKLLHVTATLLNGNPVAAHIGIVNKTSVQLAIVANSPFFAKYSVGKLHLIQLAQQFIKDNIPYFDLTPGGDPWKERFANDHDEVYELIIYNNSIEKKVAEFKKQAMVAIKKILVTIGARPEGLRELFYIIKRANLRSVLSRLQFFIPKIIEMRQYRHTLDSAKRIASEGKVKKDELSHLLKFKSTESWQNRQSFASKALERFENGEHCFTIASEDCLLHYGWMLKKQRVSFVSEVQQSYQFPENSAVLYDFYTHSKSRGMGFYQATIKQMLADVCKLPSVEYIYISVEADNQPSRHVIEKLGFEYQDSLFLLKFLIFSKKWRKRNLGGARKWRNLLWPLF